MSGNDGVRGDAQTVSSLREQVAVKDGMFAVGDLVGGNYEVRAVLGEGGMGRVYEAHDTTLNRRVAIKASWPHIERNMLLNEARALAALRHPSLAVIHGFGDHAGVAYAVLERIYGTTLEDYLIRRATEKSVLSVNEAIDLLLPLCEVLGVLHRAGLAHRDVKPANVMLAPGGRVVLMDFGISMPESRAQNQELMGTPRYMAPETVTSSIEPRNAYLVDVYAIGVLAFELLCSEAPFDADQPMELLAHHVHRAAPKVREKRANVPIDIAELVDEMLAKDPLDRPSSMEAVVFRLRRAKKASMLPPATATGGRTAPFSVLIVEDEDAIARLLERYVQRTLPDATVTRAKDAIDAMSLVAREAPDVMLLDLNLPRMSGIELGMYLRGSQLADACTIIAMSAGASDADRALLRGLGIDRFIEKGSTGLGERVAATVKAVYASFTRAR
jgi:serine/threonine-protein kinase